MDILNQVDLIRLSASKHLEPDRKSALGQFYTSAPISSFMASMFDDLRGEIRLLDPGSGPCSLAAAFAERAAQSGSMSRLNIEAYEVDESIKPYIKESLRIVSEHLQGSGLEVNSEVTFGDFISDASKVMTQPLSARSKLKPGFYTHVIMNPPYKKISSKSEHKAQLKSVGIESVNLYSAFVSLGLRMLKKGGELVAILPRSFCNGPYYQSFREELLSQAAINHIHIFDSRSNAFDSDDVLQENIIIHVKKGAVQKDVKITSSPSADFHIDEESKTITASDMTVRTLPFSSLVTPRDEKKFIHIAANNRDQLIVDKLSVFTSTLDDLEIQISTGPVVGFRLKKFLRKDMKAGDAPLIYPQHLKGKINWPISSKPNAIEITQESEKWLWKNEGNFVLTRRFTSKEESRRIVATLYDSSLEGKLVGFENKLNVFHKAKEGLDRELALGLIVFLNCSLLDKYYRLFGGHTQVNATDLRNLHYPSANQLRRIGGQVQSTALNQQDIDTIIEREINMITDTNSNDPLAGQKKIDQALEILEVLGLPKAQQNERSALTLLSLLNLHPDASWEKIELPMIGVTPIMNWCRDVYGKEYAPNTRETFRRQTLHQFVEAGIVQYNPDQPDRAVNSPKACYQVTNELYDALLKFETAEWERKIGNWLEDRETLVSKYAMERRMQMIPLTLEDGTEIHLSPGAHSQLIHDIVVEFGPRFAPAAEVIYLGDTGNKEDFFKKERLEQLGVVVDRKGKLPDVVLYWPEKDWLLLIESVTSHGPVDSKRHGELASLFKDASPGLVYITAFPDKRTMGRYLGNVSWETEVWVAEAPTHMIHFNGDRFLGPHD